MRMSISCERAVSTSMELTNFHLGKAQKQALRLRAKARGSNVAEELRSAVDAYLSGGVAPEQLELLDAATRQAQAAIDEMNSLLAATNRRAEAVFAELEALRAQHAATAR